MKVVADQVLAALQDNPVFSVLGDDVLSGLAERAPVEAFSAGDVLLAEGEAGQFGYLILDGEVSVDVDTPTGPACVSRIGSGRLVGEIGALADVARTASVVARTDVSAPRLERHVIRRCMADNPDVALNVIGRLGLRLQNTNRPMAILTRAAEALRDDAFSPEFLDSLTDSADEFSHFAGVFKNMARELMTKRSQRHEMETAQAIQQTFLPTSLPLNGHGRTQIDARMIAAKLVGGDFYDYFLIDEGRLGFLLADVSGKGVPAALFMAMTLSVLRTVASSGVDPGQCLTQTNALVAERNEQDMFVTMFYGDLDLETGDLAYANAGHEPALHRAAAGGMAEYSASGPALGLFDGATYATQSAALQPQDLLFVYSDGVTEAFDPDGAVFGDDRLRRLFADLPEDLATAVIDTVMNAVDSFAAGRERADDTTCLALVFDPSDA